MIWIIADTHFNHVRLTEMGVRPQGFSDLIIANCQKMIGAGDTVIHLGDVILGRNANLPAIMSNLPGIWVLVRGNHDSRAGWYEKRGFALAVDELVRGDVLFTHSPVAPLPVGICLNVHGHIHSETRTSELDPWYDSHKRMYRNVVIEGDLSPVALDSVLRRE